MHSIRDYEKELKGFKAKISLDNGIKEMIKIFKISKNQGKNNY